MNKDHVKEMYSEGMTFGSHGDHHIYWEFLNKEKQEKELLESISFYKELNFDIKDISVCYPYGSYNNTTLEILKNNNISFALSTLVGNLTQNNIFNKYEIPRLDTNEFKI